MTAWRQDDAMKVYYWVQIVVSVVLVVGLVIRWQRRRRNDKKQP